MKRPRLQSKYCKVTIPAHTNTSERWTRAAIQ